MMIYPLLLWDINVWWYIHFCCAMLLLWDACVFVKQCETFIVICIWLLILNVQPQRFRKYAAKLLLISHGCRPTLLHTILLIFYCLFSFIFHSRCWLPMHYTSEELSIPFTFQIISNPGPESGPQIRAPSQDQTCIEFQVAQSHSISFHQSLPILF